MQLKITTLATMLLIGSRALVPARFILRIYLRRLWMQRVRKLRRRHRRRVMPQPSTGSCVLGHQCWVEFRNAMHPVFGPRLQP
ncbi:hypothetical protein BDW59DRAFT_142538 [Aspergillus cavernicola]|uniref:Secreted protein n=1 Tax=Aspergillus cavernicola TaxID=176166 RepID=A0ABR4IMD5_9EURO